MSFRFSIGVVALLNALFCGLAPAAASTDRINATCEIKPTGAPSGHQRWMYRTDKASGQKCWFLATRLEAVQKPQRTTYRNPSDAQAMQRSPVNCLTAPDSTAPRGMQWRYRIDRAAAQKCWRLV